MTLLLILTVVLVSLLAVALSVAIHHDGYGQGRPPASHLPWHDDRLRPRW